MSKPGSTLVAIFAIVASLAAPISAHAAVVDTFDDGTMDGWTRYPSTSSWVADTGAIRHAYQPTGMAELVTPVGLGLGSTFSVSALVTTSPGRTNAGLTTLFKNHSNHIWAKIEISPGHPGGFMSIGRRLYGNTTSLLARSSVPLAKSSSYRVVLAVAGTRVSWSVYDATGTSLLKSISYSLTSTEQKALAGTTLAGFRTKTLFDEDDGDTRLDDFGLE
jgi:hypothetical protein